MTEQDRVTVNDPRGPVNNGMGPQYVFYGREDWLSRRGVAALRIVRKDRMHLADRFVAPTGYRVAADRLERPGSVVLLNAQPGSGRRAAAIMLLHRLGEDEEGVRFEELPDKDKDKDKNEDDVPLAPGEGDRFLLDLSGITDEEAYIKAQRRLAVYRSQVREAGAHMVVVLPGRMEHAHPPDLASHTVTLERPRGVAVVTRHLRMDRMAFRSTDLRSPDLQSLYDRSPMRELARLAGLVTAAHDSGRFGTDFAGWLDQAMHALTDRVSEVGHQVAAIRGTPKRALLLAAAVFEEAHSDTVYEAWRGLMRTVKHEKETTTELARTDFGKRLEKLGIERDGDGRLRFERLAYADAVRTYFWANFPGVRDDLRDWIGDAAGLGGLATSDRVKVAVRCGEQALAVGRPDHLVDLVARWADHATGTGREPRAAAALELGLSHEQFGAFCRKWTYNRAFSGPLSNGLARVLTSVCLHGLGATHPNQALVRLHYLAVREGEAAREAGEALLELACRDRRLYRPLIDRLRIRARREPHKAELHLRLLTDLLSSSRAPDPPPWPDLFLGWEAIFSQPPTALWDPLVRGWLNAVADDSTREMALGVMVGAAHGRAAGLHRLYAISCDWAGPARHPTRAAVAARLWQHIDHAQYARTKSPGAGPRTTEEAR